MSLRSSAVVDRVVTERLIVLLQSEAVEPACNVHACSPMRSPPRDQSYAEFQAGNSRPGDIHHSIKSAAVGTMPLPTR